MSKAKMAAARELIEEKQFDTARAILETVDHPTATKWLAQIDSKTSNTGSTIFSHTFMKFGYALLVLVLIGGGGFILGRLGDSDGTPAAGIAPGIEASTPIALDSSPTQMPPIISSISGHPAYDAEGLSGRYELFFQTQRQQDAPTYGIYWLQFFADGGDFSFSIIFPDTTMPDPMVVEHVIRQNIPGEDLRTETADLQRLTIFPNTDDVVGRGAEIETATGEATITQMDTTLSGEFRFTIAADDPSTMEADAVPLTVNVRFDGLEIDNPQDYFEYLDEN